MLNSLAPVVSLGPFLAVANTPGKEETPGTEALVWWKCASESVLAK